MKEVRQTKMPELSPVKPAVVTERRTGERSEPGRSGVTTAGVNHHGPLPVSVPDPEVLKDPDAGVSPRPINCVSCKKPTPGASRGRSAPSCAGPVAIETKSISKPPSISFAGDSASTHAKPGRTFFLLQVRIEGRSVAFLLAKNSIYCQGIYSIGNLKNS